MLLSHASARSRDGEGLSSFTAEASLNSWPGRPVALRPQGGLCTQRFSWTRWVAMATALAQYLAFQVALSKVERDIGARRQSRAGHLDP